MSKQRIFLYTEEAHPTVIAHSTVYTKEELIEKLNTVGTGFKGV
jgi:hypothetical protein